jgi:sulfur carrier protein ThiS
MTVTIHPFGMLKEYLAGQKEVRVDPGRSVRDTLTSLGIKPDLVAGVFVNGEQQTKDYILQEGDDIRLLAVIGGG